MIENKKLMEVLRCSNCGAPKGEDEQLRCNYCGFWFADKETQKLTREAQEWFRKIREAFG